MRKRSWGIVALLLGGFILLCGSALAEPQIPARTSSVIDTADLLEPFQEQPLANRLGTLQTRTGVDLVVVTLPSLEGYAIEEWGRSLGNGWKVGGKSGLGALLIIAPNDRQVRIEIGDALAVMFPDSAAAAIIDSIVLPNFREGRISAGILAATDAMIYQVTRPKMADVESTQSNPVPKRSFDLDLSFLRPLLPYRTLVLVCIVILLVAVVLYKIGLLSIPAVAPDDTEDFSGRTVYRNERGSIWYASSSSRDRSRSRELLGKSDEADRGTSPPGFSGFGFSSGVRSSRSSGGFSGFGSLRRFGGSSGGRSLGGGLSGRGASGRW